VSGSGHVTCPCWVVDCVTWVVVLEWRGKTEDRERSRTIDHHTSLVNNLEDGVADVIEELSNGLFGAEFRFR